VLTRYSQVDVDADIPVLDPATFDTPVFRLTPTTSVPQASLQVKLRFLIIPATYRDSNAITKLGLLYVLDRDLQYFVRYVRLFDFHMSQRVAPGSAMFGRSVLARKGRDGLVGHVHEMTCKIEVQGDVQEEQGRSLLEDFRNVHGPFHDCVIVGAKDCAHANCIAASIRDEPGAFALNRTEPSKPS
jgi:hypothetical protein